MDMDQRNGRFKIVNRCGTRDLVTITAATLVPCGSRLSHLGTLPLAFPFWDAAHPIPMAFPLLPSRCCPFARSTYHSHTCLLLCHWPCWKGAEGQGPPPKSLVPSGVCEQETLGSPVSDFICCGQKHKWGRDEQQAWLSDQLLTRAVFGFPVNPDPPSSRSSPPSLVVFRAQASPLVSLDSRRPRAPSVSPRSLGDRIRPPLLKCQTGEASVRTAARRGRGKTRGKEGRLKVAEARTRPGKWNRPRNSDRRDGSPASTTESRESVTTLLRIDAHSVSFQAVLKESPPRTRGKKFRSLPLANTAIVPGGPTPCSRAMFPLANFRQLSTLTGLPLRSSGSGRGHRRRAACEPAPP